MTIILHVFTALASIAVASYGYMRPSKTVLGTAYGLVGATFATGFYLVWSAPAHMLEACFSGLVYLSIVTLAILAARHRLVAAENN